jgi:hypothetical protein
MGIIIFPENGGREIKHHDELTFGYVNEIKMY